MGKGVGQKVMIVIIIDDYGRPLNEHIVSTWSVAGQMGDSDSEVRVNPRANSLSADMHFSVCVFFFFSFLSFS